MPVIQPRDQNPGRKSNFALGLDTIRDTVPIGLTEKEVERIKSGETGSEGAPGVFEALELGKSLEKLSPVRPPTTRLSSGWAAAPSTRRTTSTGSPTSAPSRRR